MSTAPACPQCTLENTYADGGNYVCADCGFEWPMAGAMRPTRAVRWCATATAMRSPRATPWSSIKDLKVKGSSIPLKQGTVIKNIRLVEDDAEHIEGNSDKIKGLVLKTCFLRKA